MKAIFKRFRKNEDGATAIEYGLIAALIALAIISGATLFGDSLDGLFTKMSELLDTATVPETLE
ncbi:Flp family type IVb pilin [Pseudochrobactrum asaccharolyticum]|uniref:Flp family type IVb pilin n=1 Tax=Pseudochrobactrum asaccharolyticum TaxID=354351 RepID=UPI00404127C5